MSVPSSPAAVARPLGAGAIALVLLLCLSWGLNQVSVKLVLPDIPPILQAAVRSAGALVVICAIAWARGVKLFARDGTIGPGILMGLLFGIEFALIYRGLLYTSASRASLFLYVAPFFVAIGASRLLGERMGLLQWGGLGLCFAGVALAMGIPQSNVDSHVLLGDLMVVGGGALWAATTLMVKLTRLKTATPEKALAYQVAVSIPVLLFAAWLAGERLPLAVPSTLTVAMIAYQSIWVVGLTYLIWFGMLKTYSASKLSAFTFITPLFGVAAGYFILHDALTATFGVAAALVIAGLVLVNRPGPSTTPMVTVTKT